MGDDPTGLGRVGRLAQKAKSAGTRANPLRLDDQAVASLVGHPRFDEAMLMAASATLELYRGHRALNRILNDRGRFLTGLMILDLHFVAGGGNGFTAARLRNEAAAHHVSSPGRVTALLLLMRHRGLLGSVVAKDRRLRLLVPTEGFIASYRERWQRQFKAISLVRPDGGAAIAALQNPIFLGEFAHGFVDAFRHGFRMTDAVPALASVAERDAGLLVLLSLFIADVTRQPSSTAALARRFTVSRAHVSTIVRAGEEVGLTESDGTRGGYRAGSELRETLRRMFGILFLIHLRCFEAAQDSISVEKTRWGAA